MGWDYKPHFIYFAIFNHSEKRGICLFIVMPREVCETPNAVNDIRDSFQSFLKVSGDDMELWKTSGKN